MQMETALTRLLGIRHPIVQGAMAIVSDSGLAAAVSNAGGAGIIGAGGHDAAWVRQEVEEARRMTDKPFGVNVVLMAEDREEIVDLVCALKPAFVTFGAGNPVPYIQRVKAAGILAIPVVANLKQARKVEAAGADAVIIEGMEAGGHIGKLTLMALMANVIPNVSIPVVAAGGIVDRRGLQAALAMGASGVQMGSRFFVSKECPAHENAKQRVVEATDLESVVLGHTIRHDVRGLLNRFTEGYLTVEYSEVPRSHLAGRMKGVYAKAVCEGDVENGFIQIGQSLDPIRSILSCEEIIQSMVQE